MSQPRTKKAVQDFDSRFFKPHEYDPRYPGDDTYCNYLNSDGEGCPYLKSNPIHSVGGKKIMDRIIIERREVIGEVELGNGDEPALKVAWEVATKYVSENVDDGIQVEFTFEDFRFIARAERVGS